MCGGDEVVVGGGDGLVDARAGQRRGRVGAPGGEDVVADDDVVVGRARDVVREVGPLLGEQVVDGEAQGERDERLRLRLALPLLRREAAQPPHAPRGGVAEVGLQLRVEEGLVVRRRARRRRAALRAALRRRRGRRHRRDRAPAGGGLVV